jgi:HK97 family phage prohead protease
MKTLGTLTGYACLWDQDMDMGHSGPEGMNPGAQYRTYFRPGAFRDSLRKDPVAFLISHDFGRTVAHCDQRFLRIYEDEKGMRFELEVPKTPLGSAVVWAFRDKLVKGCSLGWNTTDYVLRKQKRGRYGVAVMRADLREVSLCLDGSPRNQATAWDLRMEENIEAMTNLERPRGNPLAKREAAPSREARRVEPVRTPPANTPPPPPIGAATTLPASELHRIRCILLDSYNGARGGVSHWSAELRALRSAPGGSGRAAIDRRARQVRAESGLDLSRGNLEVLTELVNRFNRTARASLYPELCIA